MPNDFSCRLRHVADHFPTRRDAALAAGISVDQLTRYLRGENQPSFQAMHKLCAAAHISLVWLATGNGAREIDAACLYESTSQQTYTASTLPVLNLAESGQAGWFDATPLAVTASLDIHDPKAFAIVAQGLSLVPEGIQPGFLCVCSPLVKPVPRDILHVRRHDGRCTLMVYQREDADWLYLQAYMDPDKNDQQTTFQDQLRKSSITDCATVIMVKRRI
jgi:transcriptional regulator with XRE-family HTH domain